MKIICYVAIQNTRSYDYNGSENITERNFYLEISLENIINNVSRLANIRGTGISICQTLSDTIKLADCSWRCIGARKRQI